MRDWTLIERTKIILTKRMSRNLSWNWFRYIRVCCCSFACSRYIWRMNNEYPGPEAMMCQHCPLLSQKHPSSMRFHCWFETNRTMNAVLWNQNRIISRAKTYCINRDEFGFRHFEFNGKLWSLFVRGALKMVMQVQKRSTSSHHGRPCTPKCWPLWVRPNHFQANNV